MGNNKLKVVFENDDLFVIDKGAGITVNKSDTSTKQVTLQDLIDQEDMIDKNDNDEEFLKRSGIVHRLDKETSGLIIVAKNSIAFRALQEQFKERKVEKSYLALAHGEVIPMEGEISAPVGRLPWNRKRFGVLAGGRESLTPYRVIALYKSVSSGEILSFINLFPKTGRTHQIRVHLKFINHPIFGDPLYGGRKIAKEDRKLLPRVFLHAEKLSFFDPKTKEEIVLNSALPTELKDLLENFELKTDNN